MGERDARDKAKETIHELEKDPPDKLEDWPKDESKYETFGGPESEHSYDEGPEAQLGRPDVPHHEDGSVSVEGEKVDDPDEFKGDPIPGGPTDEGTAHSAQKLRTKNSSRPWPSSF